jgi:hypothetical protein
MYQLFTLNSDSDLAVSMAGTYILPGFSEAHKRQNTCKTEAALVVCTKAEAALAVCTKTEATYCSFSLL